MDKVIPIGVALRQWRNKNKRSKLEQFIICNAALPSDVQINMMFTMTLNVSLKQY